MGKDFLIFHQHGLLVRRLQHSDAPLLVKWLSDPRVLEFYEGRDRPHDLEMVRRRFILKRGNPVQGCIVEYQEKPIGYIQFYPVTEEERDKYGYPSTESVYGMDQFIGEPEYWDRGIGTLLVRAMTEHLLHSKRADRVAMDPEVWNRRAIRCYEKAGFKKVKLLSKHELHEGEMRDCWLMEYTKSNSA